jgi:hypothetical protein
VRTSRRHRLVAEAYKGPQALKQRKRRGEMDVDKTTGGREACPTARYISICEFWSSSSAIPPIPNVQLH